MRKLIYILPLLALLLCGCKENNWMDWKTQNEAWLIQNALDNQDNPNFFTTESGLQYKILYKGNTTDARPDDYSTVICDYKGSLINGQVFDQSKNARFNVRELVAGMQEGLKKIHNHGDIILYMPYDLGYGEDGSGAEGNQAGSFIPPYSTLIFTVHISSVSK